MHQAKTGGEHGFQPDRAGRSFGERQTLGLDVLRVVVRHHDIDQPRCDRFDQRGAIVFRAKRRRELEEGAVRTDVDLIQGQVIDRCGSGDGQAGFLRAPQNFERLATGYRGCVIAAARERHAAACRVPA